MAQKPETAFRTKCQKQIAQLPFTENTSIQQIAIVGVPDNLLCIRGRFVAIEYKTNVGRLSRLQEHKLGKLRAAGAYTFVARPSNWPEIMEILGFMSTTDVRYTPGELEQYQQ